MFFIKKKDPRDIARRMLIDSKWIENFYYIEKVMKGNATCMDMRVEANAFRWGRRLLFDKRDILMKQANNQDVWNSLFDITENYLDTLRNLDSEIILKIKNNYAETSQIIY